MYGIINFEAFLLTGILLNLTPGNDTIFILSKAMAQGRKAGIMSVLGVATGSIIHTTFAAFGLSIIVAESIFVFNIIKYAGAAYLLYVGFKMLTDKTALNTEQALSNTSTARLKIYRDGMLTNLLNPKVALFFISFLPQFIDPGYKNTMLPFLMLGTTFTITGTIWCLVLANFAAKISAALSHNKRFTGYLNKACGAVLAGIGIKIALDRN